LTGFDLLLPMLKTAAGWSLFVDGVVNSLVLIAGALGATLAFALLFGAALGRARGGCAGPAAVSRSRCSPLRSC
jgi:hypothetical protein